MANSEAPYFKVLKPIQVDSLILSAAEEVVIASGAVTVTQGLHTVDTESDAASDDLDTINGLSAGEYLILRPESGARTVTLRHLSGGGNIVCPGAANIALADATDHVLLVGTATQVVVLSASLLVGSALGVASVDLNGAADALILDADGDTTISAPTDNQIDIEINNADDFTFTANTFTALSGSVIATNTINETTAAAGVTIDSLLIKDGAVDLNGAADALILDADGNTTISAPTDNQIDFGINGADDFRMTANTFTALSGSTIATDTISETTGAAGVTIDSLLVKDGKPLWDDMVKATITVPDTAGGGTDALLTVDLTRADGSSVLGGARQIMIRASASGAGQYSPVDPASEASLTFGTATKGSIIATAAGWCLAETDADGEFDCTATNTDDEGLYFWVETAKKVSDLAKSCLVIGSNSDLATWSA